MTESFFLNTYYPHGVQKPKQIVISIIIQIEFTFEKNWN